MKKELIVLIIGVVLCITGAGLIVYSRIGDAIVTITYEDGTMEIKNSVKKGKVTEPPYTPTKEGYEFIGWYNKNTEFNFNKPINENLTLTAKWEEINENDEDTDVSNEFIVTFDSNGGSNVSSQTIKKNGKATKPNDPTKEGYEFVNWNLSNKEYNFDTEVTKDITLVAKWKKVEEKDEEPETTKEYKVTFDSNGGSNVSSQTIKENSKATKPNNPTKAGYEFINWYLSNKVYDFNTKVTKNITLVAKWEPSNAVVNKITLDKTSHTMNVGETVKLTATIEPSNATSTNITWTSSNTSVATVSNGTVTAVGSGTTLVTATIDGKEVSCTITVIKPITYSYEIKDVPGSTTGQCNIYIKSSEGQYVSGKVTITYTTGGSETIDIPSSGYMWPNKSAIDSITNVVAD